MSTLNELEYDYYTAQLNNKTSFDETLVSIADPLITLKSTYGISELRDTTDSTGSGSVSNTGGEYVVSTGGTASSTASLGTVEYGRYIAGFDAVAGLGMRLSADPVGEQVVRWGYFTSQNGFGFGKDATGDFVFIRKGGTDRVKRRGNEWLNKDFEYDAKNFNIYRMPHRWYGEGPVKFEVYKTNDQSLPVTGLVAAFNAEEMAILTEEINLPITVEVENGATASDITAYVGGRQFFVQGKYKPGFRTTCEFRSGVSVADGVLEPIITFRPKAAFADVATQLQSVVVTATSNNVRWQIRVNGTSSTASFGSISDLPDTETALEVDTSSTAISGGIKLKEGIATAGQGNASGGTESSLPNIDLGKAGEITLLAAGIGGAATVDAVFCIEEEW